MGQTRCPQRRIRFADARRVRRRVEARAAELGLRCGLLAVLTAVLALTVGHNKLLDEPALRHVSANLPAGTRALSKFTIGRLLARLAALDLIVYRPARGRGRFACVEIHPQFCDGVRYWRRDLPDPPADAPPTQAPIPAQAPPDSEPKLRRSGPKNVNFSPPRFLYTGISNTSLPSAAHDPADEPTHTRPIEVDVAPGAVGRVLAVLPDCYRQAPAKIRWCIGAAIKAQLKRGWREDQVIAVLGAPLPEQVHKPLVLARVRFAKNMLGAGPRLRPLQRAWDRAHDAIQTKRFVNRLACDYAELVAEVGPEVARRMATTDRYRTDPESADHEPPVVESAELTEQRAAVNAARAVRREYPHEPLRFAVRRWLAVHEPQPDEFDAGEAPAAGGDLWLTIEDLIAATPAGRCMRCKSAGAVTRESLPAPAPVCDECWELLSSDECPAAEPNADVVSVDSCVRKEAC
ncbi:hypothetical protein [Mycobacterium talmoniae]|uniref:Uncharacterized protein n=1 Tax=Mycobacterium talmoniae TaxID=1858794 RepID=A0A1S1NIQ6_9MYCO|nr:hypothetical protein [Mycobacterium talmoniae]OHV03709.1 hypothetical protein BKN37_13635 [Mycobacterium talmoniae]